MERSREDAGREYKLVQALREAFVAGGMTGALGGTLPEYNRASYVKMAAERYQTAPAGLVGQVERDALQQAFVEGAKFEYERLVLQAPLRREDRMTPFGETYRQRKARRYAAAAATYPKPQQPRVLQLGRDKFRFVVDPDATEGRVHLEEYNEYTDSWRRSDRTFYGWPGVELQALGELAANPTEDVAA